MAKVKPIPVPAVPLANEPQARFQPVGRLTPEPAPRELADLVAKAWSLKLKADMAAKAYELVKAELKKALVPGDMVTLPGFCQAGLIPRETWSITNPERLERALGAGRFRDLVDVTVKYTPTDKLIALQDDPAEDSRDIIAACLVQTVTAAISLRENKDAA